MLSAARWQHSPRDVKRLYRGKRRQEKGNQSGGHPRLQPPQPAVGEPASTLSLLKRRFLGGALMNGLHLPEANLLRVQKETPVQQSVFFFVKEQIILVTLKMLL